MKKEAYYIEEMHVADVFRIDNGTDIPLAGKRIIYKVFVLREQSKNPLKRLKAHVKEEYDVKYYVYPERKEVYFGREQELMKDGAYFAYNREPAMEKLDGYFVAKGILYEEDMEYCYNALNGITEVDNLAYLRKERDDRSEKNHWTH